MTSFTESVEEAARAVLGRLGANKGVTYVTELAVVPPAAITICVLSTYAMPDPNPPSASIPRTVVSSMA